MLTKRPYPYAFLFAVAMGIAAGSSVFAATLHVSPSAGGRQGNGTLEAPFGSVGDAVDAANPGDTIVVRQGHYSQDGMITVNKPGLKIVGITGERAVLVTKEDAAAVLRIVADNVLVQDLVLQGATYGVKLDLQDGTGTRGVTIRNCVIGSTAADCIKGINADDLKIDHCQIGPSGKRQKDNAEGIDITGSVGVTIRNCAIRDTATNGIYLKGGTRNGVIERCYITNTGHGGILLGQDTDLEFMRDKAVNEAINCVARNNIIIGTESAGIGTYSGRKISFLNNTLVDVARSMQAGVWIVTNTRNVPAEEVTCRNNIIILGGERPAMFVQDAALPDSDYNLFFSRKGEVHFIREMREQNELDHTWTLDQWQQSAGRDIHSKFADPKLDGTRWNPLAGSPAIGSADATHRPEDDYFGHARAAMDPDVGAVSAAGRLGGKSQ